MKVEEATPDDFPILAIHHRKMFQEIWELRGLELEDQRAVELESAYLEKISRQIPGGSCQAWVINKDGRIIASGAVTLAEFVPTPMDLNGTIAYLHSIFTEKDHRGQKCAQMIVEKVIEYSRQAGVRRIMLHASEAGKPIYLKQGFVPSPDTMRLLIT